MLEWRRFYTLFSCPWLWITPLTILTWKVSYFVFRFIEGRLQYIRMRPSAVNSLPVSRLESDISRISAKVAISCRLHFPTIKFQLFCVVWATDNIEHFLINSKYELFKWYQQLAFWAQMTSSVSRYDVIYLFFPVNSQYMMTWQVDSPENRF